MSEFKEWRIENTTEEEREKLFSSDFDYYYDGVSPTVLIDGSREQFEDALRFIGRKWNSYFKTELEENKMKEEINVKELIEIFEDMAKRETLLARGGVTQEDLLIQIKGVIAHVAMQK